jgi:hypothetical protein
LALLLALGEEKLMHGFARVVAAVVALLALSPVKNSEAIDPLL